MILLDYSQMVIIGKIYKLFIRFSYNSEIINEDFNVF